MRFEVNGSEWDGAPSGHTAVEVIRGQLGLTGTKLVCGTGACGACVVLVDGVPVASCLLPVPELEGRHITTIEGVADGEELHPVQRAFLADDGFQCGFCTPGFVVEAVAFHDAWRAANGSTRPSRDEVARALAGHLCRCGAYEGILRAVGDACEGVFDSGPVTGRAGGEDKVTGRALYTVDVRLPAMAHGAIVRSTEAHAEIEDVDVSAVLAMPGVLAYVPWEGLDRVRYVGQPIGAVAAVDRETARRAAAAVDVTYRVLPNVVTMDAALSDEAPDLHDGGWTPESASEGFDLPTLRRKNLHGPGSLASIRRFTARRRIAAARRQADPRLVAGTWAIHSQAHNALEPHAAVARWLDGDRLEVHASSQTVEALARQLEKRHGAAEATVLAESVGGAFGAKQMSYPEIDAAVRLARASGRPVRVVATRPEELTVGGYRPGAEVELDLLADTERIHALHLRTRNDGGVNVGQFPSVFVRLAYPGAPMSLHDYDIVTTTPPAAPFRGPSAPAALFAVETAIDELAERLDSDPIELRSKWSPRPARSRLYRWASELEVWRGRRPPGPGRHRTGLGVAFATWFSGHDPETAATVSLENGRLVAACGIQDMGQGSREVLRAAVADVFGVPARIVETRIGDSRLGHGPTSNGSRTTASVYPAAAEAAATLREQLVGAAVSVLGMEGAEPTDGGMVHAGELVPWPEVLERLPDSSATAERPGDDRMALTPNLGGLKIGRGFTEGAVMVEVEVDTVLGRVRPTRAWLGIAAGRIHAPAAARSQLEGAMIQGLGYALFEHRQVDPLSGVTVTADLDSFRIAGIGDAPEIEVHFDEAGFEYVPGGGVGLAELATIGVVGAAANAVAHATGWRPRSLPITPDRVAEAVLT